MRLCILHYVNNYQRKTELSIRLSHTFYVVKSFFSSSRSRLNNDEKQPHIAYIFITTHYHNLHVIKMFRLNVDRQMSCLLKRLNE